MRNLDEAPMFSEPLLLLLLGSQCGVLTVCCETIRLLFASCSNADNSPPELSSSRHRFLLLSVVVVDSILYLQMFNVCAQFVSKQLHSAA